MEYRNSNAIQYSQFMVLVFDILPDALLIVILFVPVKQQPKRNLKTCMVIKNLLRDKCPYFELFQSVFSRIRTEYGEILRISPYSDRMRENTDRITPNKDTFYAVTRFNQSKKVWGRKLKVSGCADQNWSWSRRVTIFCTSFDGFNIIGMQNVFQHTSLIFITAGTKINNFKSCRTTLFQQDIFWF